MSTHEGSIDRHKSRKGGGISHEALQAAIAKYHASGGRIEQLPTQKIKNTQVVQVSNLHNQSPFEEIFKSVDLLPLHRMDAEGVTKAARRKNTKLRKGAK